MEEDDDQSKNQNSLVASSRFLSRWAGQNTLDFIPDIALGTSEWEPPSAAPPASRFSKLEGNEAPPRLRRKGSGRVAPIGYIRKKEKQGKERMTGMIVVRKTVWLTGTLLVVGLAMLALRATADEPQAKKTPCCFKNPRYTGTCEVTPGEDESCASILAYLNNQQSVGKNYCANTPIRGGWATTDCEKKTDPSCAAGSETIESQHTPNP